MTFPTERDNAEHYERVVEPWRWILGEDFHVGCFEAAGEAAGGGTGAGEAGSPEAALAAATARLVDRLADWGGLAGRGPGARVLDVGCGIGSAARRLHRRFQCRVTGITLAERERLRAAELTEAAGLAEAVDFRRADALDNGLADEMFDCVWQLESSHLMADKERLFRENFRVLRSGGGYLLCDFTLRRRAEVADLFRWAESLKAIERAFGKVKNETLDTYRRLLERVGFGGIGVRDVTAEVEPTIAYWRRNLAAHETEVLRSWGRQEVADFRRACDAVETLFEAGFLGYGFVRACKPGAGEAAS